MFNKQAFHTFCPISGFFKRDNMEGQYWAPRNDVIQKISRRLRQALGISLFGIDIIINNQTGQHAVIDINAFPGTCSSSQSLEWVIFVIFMH